MVQILAKYVNIDRNAQKFLLRALLLSLES